MTVVLGDCVTVMREMDAESIDAVVTDPPYSLSFMGKAWDSDVSHAAWAAEAFRVAKPGAHLLAFGGTRTVHRMTAALEDAGWEIRDMLVWAYASGFPKSLDVSKAIDARTLTGKTNSRAIKEASEARPTSDEPDRWAGRYGDSGTALGRAASIEQGYKTEATTFRGSAYKASAPATPDAAKWNGWGTALKPAWEPIVLARKPLRGTVAANVLKHGTGALNIDGTRIGTTDTYAYRNGPGGNGFHGGVGRDPDGSRVDPVESNPLGRWPANVILTDPIFDGGVEGVVGGGETRPGEFPDNVVGQGASYEGGWGDAFGRGRVVLDTGTYSRFFLVPKSSRSDREPILPPEWYDGGRANSHPTCKPTDLMRHLVRLVTPPGGTCLDPFLGSGTTAIAAEMEGFAWVGIEREAEYVAIAEARLNGTQRGLGLVG